MSRLLMVATAPVVEIGKTVELDNKFVEGMGLHNQYWPGQVDCCLRRGAKHIPYGSKHKPADLSFGLILLDRDEPLSQDMIKDYDLVICAADDHSVLHVAAMAKRAGVRMVYTIEYTLETRLQIIKLDRHKNLPRRIYSMLWNIWHERRRRRAFALADGIQANGYPAFESYAALNKNTMVYLDNRMNPDLFVTEQEMQDRTVHIRSGGPLRLVFSGRLEALKGVQFLLPVAQALKQRQTNFTLDIFGQGSLLDELKTGIVNMGLQDCVTLHDPVDFESELVPYHRTSADIYLCCHPQSDPSCTYIESMGCGMAIMGFKNRMWTALLASSGAGWGVPIGNIQELANRIEALDKNRDEIIDRCGKATDFAREHCFDNEFSKRMQHLRDVAGVQF